MTALQKAFSRHEKIRRMLANLDELKKNGEIDADQYTRMKSQYDALMENATENLRVIRGQIKEQRQQAQESLNSVQANAVVVSTRGKVGELTAEKVAAELRTLQSKKDTYTRNLQQCDGWLAARSSMDVGGYVDVNVSETVEHRSASTDLGKVIGDLGERAKTVGSKAAGSAGNLITHVREMAQGREKNSSVRRPAVIAVLMAGGGVLLLLAVITVLSLGHILSGGHVFGSPYSAEYEIVAFDAMNAGLKATVRGPANNLAVILTDPNGKSRVESIDSREMITNAHDTKMYMEDLLPGKWTLSLKTLAPEKIVWKDTINFEPGNVEVEDVKLDLEAVREWGGRFTGEVMLNGLEITMRKDKNLPVRFTDLSVVVGDAKAGFGTFLEGRVMVDKQSTLKAVVSILATPETLEGEKRRGTAKMLPSINAVFGPGDKCPVKGTISLVGGRNGSVDFEKELVVSADVVREAQGRVDNGVVQPPRPPVSPVPPTPKPGRKSRIR